MPEMIVWPVSSSSRDAERRILLGEPREAAAELVLVGLRLRLDSDRDDRVGERHRLEHDRGRLERQRVAGRRRLEADARGDLAGADLVALLAVVRVHLEDAPDALGLAGRRVENAVAGLQLAAVDAEVRQLADVRVGHHLERERRERLVQRRLALELDIGLRVEALDRGHVERARQVVDDGVEQRLHALVLEGGAEQHRRDLVGERPCANRAAEHVGGDRVLVGRGTPRAPRRRSSRRRRSAGGGTPAPARRARRGCPSPRSPGRGRPCRRSPSSRRGRRRRGGRPPGRSGSGSEWGSRRGARPSTARRRRSSRRCGPSC